MTVFVSAPRSRREPSALLRQAGDKGDRREDAMHSLEPTRKMHLQAEAVEPPWGETISPQCVAANLESPPRRATDDGDRRFLTALLRALSVWCT